MRSLRNMSQGLYDLSALMKQYLNLQSQLIQANRLLDEDDAALIYFTKRLAFLRTEIVNLPTDEIPGPDSHEINIPIRANTSSLASKSERLNDIGKSLRKPKPSGRPNQIPKFVMKGGGL